ncbi:MAG: TolC family protein [Ignavibacteriae bacterium]|nr:TolC family protein [Ignavibacteriota bacterium]
MKRILFLTTVLLFSTNLFAQKTLTLEEAISIALQRNSNLIKGTNLLLINKAEIKSAFGALLPDFGLSGGWSWEKRQVDEGSVSTVIINDQLISAATETDTRSYNLRAGGSITLFNGLSNYAKISQKNKNLESAELNLEKLKQDIVYNTATFYYAVLGNKELVKVREDNVTFNQKLLETITERNKVGAIPLADVYTQQVQYGNAQLLLIQAENDYESSINSLLNYLALDIMDEYNLVDPLSQSSNLGAENEVTGDLETLVGIALNNRVDYASQKLDLEAADNGITMAKSGLFPSLSGNYSFSTSGIKPDNLFDRRIYNVGLSLNVPIFSNWNTETGIQYANVTKLNEMEDLAVLERTIKIEVKISHLDLTASKKRLDVSSTNVTAAKENRRVNKERYNLGSGTILDVLQSNKDYTTALTENIKAKFEYKQNRDKLLNALGKLEYKKY